MACKFVSQTLIVSVAVTILTVRADDNITHQDGAHAAGAQGGSFDALAYALDQSLNILADGLHASSDTYANASSLAERDRTFSETVDRMRQLAAKLVRRHDAVIGSLRADTDVDLSKLDMLQQNVAVLKAENQRLQSLVVEEQKNAKSCGSELEAASLAGTPKCAQLREADAIQFHMLLQNRSANWSTALHVAQSAAAECKNAIANARAENELLNASLVKAFKALGAQGVISAHAVNTTATEAHVQPANGIVNATLASLRRKVASLEEAREDQTDFTSDLQAANKDLKRRTQAWKDMVTSLQKDVEATNSDKAHLLDSMRALVRQNGALERKIARLQMKAQSQNTTVEVGLSLHPPGNIEPASKETKSNSRGQVASRKAASMSTGRRAFADPVAWMGRMNKINDYLNRATSPRAKPQVEPSPDDARDFFNAVAAHRRSKSTPEQLAQTAVIGARRSLRRSREDATAHVADATPMAGQEGSDASVSNAASATYTSAEPGANAVDEGFGTAANILTSAFGA